MVGTLDRSAEIVYEPIAGTRALTEFTMVDLEGNTCRVKLARPNLPTSNAPNAWCSSAKPPPGRVPHARDMLMKCPSKYNEENRWWGPEVER